MYLCIYVSIYLYIYVSIYLYIYIYIYSTSEDQLKFGKAVIPIVIGHIRCVRWFSPNIGGLLKQKGSTPITAAAFSEWMSAGYCFVMVLEFLKSCARYQEHGGVISENMAGETCARLCFNAEPVMDQNMTYDPSPSVRHILPPDSDCFELLYGELLLTDAVKEQIQTFGRVSRFQLYAAHAVRLLTQLSTDFSATGSQDHTPSQWTEMILDFLTYYASKENSTVTRLHNQRFRRQKQRSSSMTPIDDVGSEVELPYYDVVEHLLAALFEFAKCSEVIDVFCRERLPGCNGTLPTSSSRAASSSLPATPEKNNNQNQLDVQYADTAEDNMVDEGLSKDKFPYLRTLLRRCSSDTPYEHDLLARLFNHLSESPKFIKCIEEIDADGAYDGTLFIFQLLKHDGMQDVVHKIADRLANHSPKLKQQLRSIADVLGDHSLKKVLYPKTEVYVDTTSIPDVYIDQKQISLVDCDKWEVWKRDKFERVKPVRKKSSPNALKKAGSEGSLRELYELTVADVRMILEAKGAASDGLNLLT